MQGRSEVDGTKRPGRLDPYCALISRTPYRDYPMSPRSGPDPQREPVVIGQEMADAYEAERKRIEAGGPGRSPIPEATYDLWRGELRLTDPRRLPLDSQIAPVCRSFAQLDAGSRSVMRRSISMDEFYTLLTFSRRAAVFAMREGGSDLIDGLTALAMIEAERVDYRDILVALSLLHHAGVRAGKDPEGLFRDAAALAEPAVSNLIDGFAARRPADRDLRDAWGFDEVETEGGVGLIGWGFRRYQPTQDLKRIALELAALLDADRYQPDDPEVATELPTVWFRGVSEPSLDETLRAIRAGATVRGRLRPEVDSSYTSQQLNIFLAELPDHRLAGKLLEVSRQPSEGFWRLGVAEGRLFSLTVARSFVQGVQAYETRGSLGRFGPGIARILRQ